MAEERSFAAIALTVSNGHYEKIGGSAPGQAKQNLRPEILLESYKLLNKINRLEIYVLLQPGLQHGTDRLFSYRMGSAVSMRMRSINNGA